MRNLLNIIISLSRNTGVWSTDREAEADRGGDKEKGTGQSQWNLSNWDKKRRRKRMDTWYNTCDLFNFSSVLSWFLKLNEDLCRQIYGEKMQFFALVYMAYIEKEVHNCLLGQSLAIWRSEILGKSKQVQNKKEPKKSYSIK